MIKRDGLTTERLPCEGALVHEIREIRNLFHTQIVDRGQGCKQSVIEKLRSTCEQIKHGIANPVTWDVEMKADDRAPGMDQPIARRDFLNGVMIAGGSIASAILSKFATEVLAGEAATDTSRGYYPPSLTGLRGSHPGSFELAHKLRHGDLPLGALRSAESYDLVIVGGGISGLAAAYFYRERKPSAHILVLDNHDDFGGHAKRNEFELGGRIELINGGTLGIDSPRPYGVVAARLLRKLGV